MEYIFFVLVIVLSSLAIGGFSVWLEHKQKMAKLGESSKDLEREVATLREHVNELEEKSERRLQNLEAIVTSRKWDPIEPSEAPLREKFLDITDEGETEKPNLEEETARIAGRLES